MRAQMTVAALMWLAAPAALRAQRLAAPLPSYAPPARISSPLPQPAGSKAPDYRWEGLAIGAVGGGLFGAYVFREFCGAGDTGHPGSCVFATIEGGLIGATVFGVVGGLIGTMFPKAPEDST